MDKGTIWSQC